jgi:dTDP-D-glucose 4,6-dehydratase
MVQKILLHTNINGTFSLLESLRFLQKKKITPKLIHVSTDEVYGDIQKGVRSDENINTNQVRLTQLLKQVLII